MSFPQMPKPDAPTSRDNPLWLQLWHSCQTDFHQASVNPLLDRFWPALKLAPASRVFVPLCGKSLDLIWLAEQGHEVIGVELSPIAVRDFFRENGLQPRRQRQGALTRWYHGNIQILCGDYFSLTAADLGRIDAVYDRAALTALPADIRTSYVTTLCQLLPAGTGIFLLTVEDMEEREPRQLARSIDKEIGALFENRFRITLAHVESQYEIPQQPSVRTDYKLYLLSASI